MKQNYEVKTIKEAFETLKAEHPEKAAKADQPFLSNWGWPGAAAGFRKRLKDAGIDISSCTATITARILAMM
ncbi:MAG: hypothetical protein ACLUVV_06790 [Christensenellales bacterium]